MASFYTSVAFSPRGVGDRDVKMRVRGFRLVASAFQLWERVHLIDLKYPLKSLWR